ncbi:ribbon-helix-helix protein, CopG family [Natrinema sp. H-ect1]|uniref:ribbon-helix-helix protein, CopG family n=1 Tax=Natrinema sp. H-ect1 TaxID=3242700 RepID=UPI00359D2B36
MQSDSEGLEVDAPDRLLERADVLATALGTSRSELLVAALRDYLENAREGPLEGEVAAAYYDDEIAYEELTALVGKRRAADFRLLKRQLEEASVDGSPDP